MFSNFWKTAFTALVESVPLVLQIKYILAYFFEYVFCKFLKIQYKKETIQNISKSVLLVLISLLHNTNVWDKHATTMMNLENIMFSKKFLIQKGTYYMIHWY